MSDLTVKRWRRYGNDRLYVSRPHDVHVVAHKKLTAWLQNRPPTLAGDRVHAIAAVAHRSTTWT